MTIQNKKMKSKNLKKSTENLTKIATKNWQIIPEELQMALKNHVEILNSYFTDIIINPDLLPETWRNDQNLLHALKNYLEFLQKSGRIITNEVVKSCVNLIYIKLKDDVKAVADAYNFSTVRNYMSPYPQKDDAVQILSVVDLPNKDEIKSAFESYFKDQKVHENLIAHFMSFNRFAKDQLNDPITGKRLYTFIKELAKTTEYHTGRVFTTLKYLADKKSMTIPPDFSPILNWHNKQKS